jgi:hypothetical protein
LKEAFKEAADIASVVPESMQERAFERALNEILGGSSDQVPASRTKERKATRRKGKQLETAEETDDLLNRIDRTQYSEVSASMSVLDRSLSVLRIAKELGTDGLPAPKIAEILTDNFRVKTLRQHVNQQLDKATKLVAREKVGRSVTYKIMGVGEKHLDDPVDSAQSNPRRARKAKRPTKLRKAPTRKAKWSGTNSAKTSKRSGGRPGPKAAVQSLIDAGFFKEPRTIGDIQSRLQTKVGHVYKPGDLSPTLGRLLRDGALDRDRNESHQYEYKQPRA